MDDEKSSNNGFPWQPRKVLAGTAVALLVVPTVFFVLGMASSGNSGWNAVTGETLRGTLRITRASGLMVLFPGLPLALLTERLCARARLPLTLLAFAFAGVVAGLIASLVLTSGGFFFVIVPFAVLSAVLGRAFATPVARRPVLCWGLVLLAAAVLAGALLTRLF
ncbi:hypothetical protein ACOQFL_02265 [Actinopolyspora sp. H202]|uniref:hypothetical protein n=1 Tax=Actinopolyspora sp. H202 TaxID=1500456 RepID=UPI003EE595C9